MSNQTKSMSLASTRYVVLFIAYITVSVAAPIISHHYQPLSGTLVNTILFLSVLTLGLREALIISLIPSLIAYYVGLLPKALLPIIPIIMLSNIILVTVFNRLNKKSYAFASVVASLIKFIVIFSASVLVASLLLPHAFMPKIVAMFGWMQLITALFGSIVAYLIIKLTNTDTSK